MNSKQRRQVKRAFQRIQLFDWYIATGGPDDGSVRAQVAKHVRPLVDRSAGPYLTRRANKRDPRTYGLRCPCGRKAHGIDSNNIAMCRAHGDWLPF